MDELIAAEQEKWDALSAHKKGLLQQLFPAKGEKVPKLWFGEFEGVWEEKRLEILCKKISSGKDKNNQSGRFELYGSTGVIGKSISGTYDGDYILIARVGANAGFLNKVSGEFGVTDKTLVLTFKDKSNISYIFYWLDSFGLNRFVFGSGQPLITGKQLKRLSVPLPVLPG